MAKVIKYTHKNKPIKTSKLNFKFAENIYKIMALVKVNKEVN